MTSNSQSETDQTDIRYHHGDLRRALIAAALTLLTEEQDWSFSLREVARRAGVSHNAPYNHFENKDALLAAVAATGYDTLRVRMQEAAAQTQSAPAALKAIGLAYVRFGVGNPAHYRLMFGNAVMNARLLAAKNNSPSSMESTTAKGVLMDVIRHGAEQGRFAVSLTDTQALDTAVLSAWSLVHGLTMLLLDGLAGAGTPPEALTAPIAERSAEYAIQFLLDGICVQEKASE